MERGSTDSDLISLPDRRYTIRGRFIAEVRHPFKLFLAPLPWRFESIVRPRPIARTASRGLCARIDGTPRHGVGSLADQLGVRVDTAFVNQPLVSVLLKGLGLDSLAGSRPTRLFVAR